VNRANVKVISERLPRIAMKALADDFTIVYDTIDKNDIYCYSPGLCKSPEWKWGESLDIGDPGIARSFTAGNRLYSLGHSGDLMFICLKDKGLSWSVPRKLSEEQHWRQAPCNVHYNTECVYPVGTQSL
jgi:hypothetical protein